MFKHLALFIALGCSACAPAFAQEPKTEIIVGGFSKHINAEEKFNETNETLGFAYNDWELLAFNNSYNDWSFAASKHIRERIFEKDKYSIDLGLRLALVYGYNEEDTNIDYPVLPFFTPTATLWRSHYGIEVGLIPIFNDQVDGVLMFSMRYKY